MKVCSSAIIGMFERIFFNRISSRQSREPAHNLDDFPRLIKSNDIVQILGLSRFKDFPRVSSAQVPKMRLFYIPVCFAFDPTREMNETPNCLSKKIIGAAI